LRFINDAISKNGEPIDLDLPRSRRFEPKRLRRE
jgi:hypothetical protein